VKLNWAEKWVVNNPLRVLEQRIEARWFKRAMTLEAGARCLEIGCGRGAGARLIAETFSPFRVFALDLDIHMIRKSETYLQPGERERISLLVGDALYLPFFDACLDAVFGFGFLHHVPDWRGALDEIARVLKPGGIYFLEELYPALYRNMVTKRLLLHPEQDRFRSRDLHQALEGRGMPIRKSLEHGKMGILAAAVKRG